MKKNLKCFTLAVAVVSAFVFSACKESPAKTATKANMYFGVAIQPGDILDESKAKLIADNFNAIVPENTMKMVNIRPTKTLWNFSDMDKMVDFAQKNKMMVRGHTFIWHQQNSTIVNQIKSREDAFALINENINQIMTRYKGKIACYDVANEIFNEDGTFRKSLWYRWCGTDLYEEAFRIARAADPDAKLFLNDYSHEEAGTPKAEAFYEFVKSMVEKGVPIDGVGFQLHLCTDYGLKEDALRENIRRFAALGLEVQFTEIDVRMKMPASEADVAKQKGMYETLMRVLKDEPNVSTYMTWGYTDANSWVPATFHGYGDAHLFDKNLKAKSVFDSLVEMMRN
ncbi:endo-1,4-beta-xylanase [Treponema sp.]|uniref:endo-1,4-beta-xylanase n=1 Tax=Treponema sp. TaxID=166 RepID=UPI00389073B5